MDAAVPEAFIHSPPGSILETCPAASGIVFEIAGRLAEQGGTMLIIDYGYLEDQLGSSLQAVSGHEKVDPFADPGERDLTAHINFAELSKMALARGAEVHGPVNQGDFLTNLGIKERADVLTRSAPDQAQIISDGLDRLISPAQMGELFKVMAICSSRWQAPEGFAT